MKNKEKAYIFDLDGTLADREHRGPYDYSKIREDKPIQHVIDVLKSLHHCNYNIIIVSGREGTRESYEQTEDWLFWYNIPYDELIMRGVKDNRKDSIIKQEIYENEIKDRFDVQAVFDDRNQVVEMWREIGLPCYQVALGDF